MRTSHLIASSIAAIALLTSGVSATEAPINLAQSKAQCQQSGPVPQYNCPAPPVPTISFGDSFLVDASANQYDYLSSVCYLHFYQDAAGQRAWNLTGFNITTDTHGDRLVQDSAGNTFWYGANGDGFVEAATGD